MINQIADFYYSYATYAYVGYFIVAITILLLKPSGPLAGSKWLLCSAITFIFINIISRALFVKSASFPIVLKQFLWMISTCSELMGMALFLLYCHKLRKLI